MLIRRVLSSGLTRPLLLPVKSSLRPIGPYSCTRHGWFRLPPIDQYSSLLPPVLRTPRHRRLGGPLPRRLANVTRANPYPMNLSNKGHAASVVMGYYKTFPSPIPQIRACCSRVTHPSAGRRHCIATTRCPSTCMC